MDTPVAIKRALIEMVGANPNLPITATVVSIENDTCTIKLLSGLELSDVRLNATIADDDDKLLITPKVGSEVLVMSQTGTLSGLVVIKTDSAQKIEFKKKDFEITIDGLTGKVTLKKASANFGTLINDLIDTINTAVINTPAGPGNISPTTVTKLTKLKMKFNLILNTN